MLLWLVLFFVIIAVVMFTHKLVMKSRMQKQLGRRVEDRELTSLTAWMEDNKGNDQSVK
jgi:predicted neutral ceramidase superfamily lipid hydrolase